MNIEDLKLQLSSKVAIKNAIGKSLEESITNSSLDVEGLKAKELELNTVINEINALNLDITQAQDGLDNKIKNTTEGDGIKMVKGNLGVYSRVVQFMKDTIDGGRSEVTFTNDLEGVTTDGNELILRKDIIFAEDKEERTDLTKLFTVIPVKAKTGDIVKPSSYKDTLYSKAELAKTPQLANPVFGKIDWSIETYAGKLPISAEMVKDAAIDVEAFIRKCVASAVTTKKNSLVLAQLNSLPTKTINTVEDLRTLVLTEISVEYKNTFFILSQSAAAEIGNLTYADGRPRFVADPNNETFFKIHGKQVVVVEDELLGEAGDVKAYFVAKEAIAIFDREQVSTKWQAYDEFGEVLSALIRIDVKKYIDKTGVQLVLDFLDTPTVPEG